MSTEVRSAPGVRQLERLVEGEDVVEIVSRVRRLAHEQAKFHHRKHNVAKVLRTGHAPVLEHQPSGHPETVEREVTNGARELPAVDMAALRHTRLVELESGKHKQVRALVKASLTQPDLIPNTFTKRQLGQCRSLLAKVCRGGTPTVAR